MSRLYLDMKFIGEVPNAYRMGADELAGVSGMNLGNFVFRHALRFLVAELDSFTCVTGLEFRDMIQHEPPETVLVSCANWLGTSDMDEQFNGGRASIIEKADCPVIAFGLGVQAPLSATGKPVSLRPNTVRLAKVMSERCKQLSVRDELTRMTLEANGIDNAVVTGCPSGFINCDPHLGAKSGKLALDLSQSLLDWKDVRSAISEVTGGHPESGKVLSKQIEMLEDTPAFYIVQTPMHLKFLIEDRAQIGDIYRKNNPFMKESGRLTRTLKSKILHFSSVDAWMDFSRTCDLSVGMRIHGTVVPLQSGIPSVLIAHDSRTIGLADIMSVPHISPETFLEIAAIGPQALFETFAEQIANYDVNRKTLAQTMQDYLVANGLTPHEALNGLLA
ncbi:polysaccharide pyruvyl transferase family protein [Roseovarius sp. 217]|uniref:polysaccharide pyruvyl transferase family protein n=1 Tax=Roseovarius sp. (strain 217) TaxID=314264 RepID=UPI0002F97070|nr:polysaccharide pyruvyl transferase family protein [Roseovarius sp. 217]